jgi:hypothetical protein
MDKWFESKLSQLGKLDYYKKPEKYRGLKRKSCFKKRFYKKNSYQSCRKRGFKRISITTS